MTVELTDYLERRRAPSFCNYILTAYYGYHVYDIPEGAVDPVASMKWNYANSIIYNPILALVKASFIWTLIKLRSSNKWINRCLWATLILNGCFAIAAPVVCILQCNPIARYWNSNTVGRCVSPGAYTVSTSSVVLATDVFILLMPTWILHDLRMPFGRKVMVIAFLSFGVAVTIVGAVRTSVLVKVFVVGEVVPDPTYEVNYTLSNIESGLAIVGTCGPTIKFLLGCCIPALRTPNDSSNRAYTYPPTDGSQSANRSKRYTKGTRADNTFKGIDQGLRQSRGSSGKCQSDDNVELTDVAGGTRSDGQRTNSDENLVITKTVAWRVDASQPDSNSTHEHNINTPHTVL
ncbi:hypothetical protein EKO04_008934 [Ascochyta lentis]|uniref:Rhodopsin domain-containing protein n=1 Tax=Ascochyta lentis TaxID=205686 RepID=A0A8H7IYZ0_9PLEO|nr:hypothetical protein EKO04_008934 [Ascochyta lentis]